MRKKTSKKKEMKHNVVKRKPRRLEKKTQLKRELRESRLDAQVKMLNAEIDKFIEATLDRLQNDAVFGKKWRA